MKSNILRFLAGFWTISLGIALPFTTSASERVQWTIDSGGNGHYYQAFSAPNGISWQQARNAALALGGDLATVTSAEENDFIYNLASADDSLWFSDGSGHGIGPWLGGLQPAGSAEPDGGWTWVTGETFSYTSWATFEPSDGDGIENRISYFALGGLKDKTWNDYPADPQAATRPPVISYIVEWPSAAAQGEIAVYRIAAAYTQIGDARIQQAAVSGYMLIDLSSTNIVVLRVHPVRKIFRESVPTVSVANVNASAGCTYTAIKFHSDDLVTALAKGPNVHVTVKYDSSRHPINMAIPTAFTVGGSDLLTSSTGETVTRDYRGEIVFDRLLTLAANKKGYDASTYSGVLQADLAAKGYTASP